MSGISVSSYQMNFRLMTKKLFEEDRDKYNKMLYAAKVEEAGRPATSLTAFTAIIRRQSVISFLWGYMRVRNLSVVLYVVDQ